MVALIGKEYMLITAIKLFYLILLKFYLLILLLAVGSYLQMEGLSDGTNMTYDYISKRIIVKPKVKLGNFHLMRTYGL